MEAFPSKRKPATRLPQFNLPKLKKIKRDLLTNLQLDSHECQYEILAVVRKSFHFRDSNTCYEFLKVQAVHNPELTGKYLERRKEMKSNGYPDAIVADTYAFVSVDSSAMAEKICKEGLRCGNQQTSALGVPSMAVHLCKHADVVTPSKPKPGERMMLVFKVVKGKVKTVLCKNTSAQLEPTPNCDCHVAKTNVDQTANLAPHMFFYSTQLYVYEYGDFDLEDYPRQVLPYAIVSYKVTDPQLMPKPMSNLPQLQQSSMLGHQVPSSTAASLESPSAQNSGPSNEVWKGRLHVRLTEGGHIYIEVSIFSYFVPLTVNLISPIKIHALYPEHNAQFTFFAGLTNISQAEEVEWREHYFRSCLMRPRSNNEEHFKALVKHISTKREIPTVRLPNDVFMFLMPNSLLSSQLGFTRSEDRAPVLHCVLMSKFSTIKAEKKKLSKEKKVVFHNLGRATSWENLFDDSDFSEDDKETNKSSLKGKLSVRQLRGMFDCQRGIHNKFAAMSLMDADVNFGACACRKLSVAKSQQQLRRDEDVKRVFAAVQSAVHTSTKSKSHFPPGSRHKPKQKMSRRAREMPSFSPHGSSESDSDSKDSSDSRRTAEKRKQDRFSLLHSTKTVEEELSEEDELTNEQMEAIIFLRKPALSTSSSVLKVKTPKTASPVLPEHKSSLKSSHSTSDLQKTSKDPSLHLRSTPKIIPTEPMEQIKRNPALRKDTGQSKYDSVLRKEADELRQELAKLQPKIIPTEPVVSVKEPFSSSNPAQARAIVGTTVVPKPLKPSLGCTDIPKCTSSEVVTSSLNHIAACHDSNSKTKSSPSSTDLYRHTNSISSALSFSFSDSPVPNSSRTSVAESSHSHTAASVPTNSKISKSSSSLSTASPVTSSKPLKSCLSRSNTTSKTDPTPVKPCHGLSDTSFQVSSKPVKNSLGNGNVPFCSGTTSNPVKSSPLVSDAPMCIDSPKKRGAFPSHEENDSEDVDMRLPHSHIPQIHPAFLSASTTLTSPLPSHGQRQHQSILKSPSKLFVSSPSKEQKGQLSPNLAFGSWLAPGEVLPQQPQTLLNPAMSDSQQKDPFTNSSLEPFDAPSPVSLPDESPPSPAPIASPVDSPASPMESPASPPSPSPLDSSESPESPPQSAYSTQFRSSPIAIPTDRVKLDASPEANHSHIAYSPTLSYVPNGAGVSVSRDGIDSIEDMKDFLNAGFDSDLDSSYDDDSDFTPLEGRGPFAACCAQASQDASFVPSVDEPEQRRDDINVNIMLPARSDVKGEMECQGNFCEAADLKLCMACYTSGTARSCSQTFLPFPCTTCDDDDSLKISLSENCGLFCCSPVAEHLSKQDDAFFEECEVSFELTPLEECFSSLSEVRKEHGFRRCHSLIPGRPRILNRADFILEQCTNIYKRDQHAGCSLFCWNCGHNLWSKSGLSMDCGIIEEVNDLKESYSKEECSLQHFDFKGFDNACKLRWGFQEEEVDFAKVAGLFHLYSPQHFPFLMTTVMPFCVAQESTSGGLPKVTAEGECQTEHCGDRGSDPIRVDVLHQSSCSFTPKHGRMCGENLAEKHADAEGICEENIQEENSSSNSTVGLKFVSGEISCADRVDFVGEHSQIAAAVGFSAFDYDDTIVEDSVLETVGSSPVPNHRLHCYPVLNVLSKNFLQESPNVSHKTEPAMALSHLPKDSLAMASDSESCSNKLPSRIEEDSIIYDIVTDNKDQTLDEGKGPAQALFQFSDSTPYFSVFSNDESRVSCYKQKLDTHFNSGIVLKNWLKPNLQKEEDPVHFFSSEEETELVPNLKFVVASAISSTPVMTCSSKEKVKSESEETSTNFDGHRSKGEKQICLSSVKQSTKESKIFAEREIHGEVKRNSATPTAWKVVMHQCSVMLHDVRQVIPSLGAHVDLTSLTCETQHKLGVEFKAKVLIDEGANSGCKKTGLMLLSPAAVPSCPGPKDVVLIRSLARVQRIKEVQNGLMKLRNTMENSEFPAVNESLLQKFPKRQIGCKFKPKETITGGKRLKYSKLQQFSCEKNTSPSQSTSHIGDGSDRRTEPEVKENASSPNRQRIHAETLRPADSSHHHEKSRKIKHSNEPSKTRRKKEKSGKTEKKKSASHKLSSGTAKRSGDTKSESSYTSQTDKNSCFGRLAPKPEFAVSETWTDSDSTERNMISCRTSNAEFSKKNWSLETWQDFLETKPCSNASPTKIKHHSLKYLYKKDKSAKEHPHGLQDEENNKSVLQDHSLTHRHVSKTPRMSPLSVQRESPVVKTHTKVRKSELAKGKSKKVCLSKSASSSVKSSVHIPNSSSLRSGQTSETRRKDRDGLEGQKSQSRKDKHSNEKESWKLEKHAQKDCQECSVFPKSLGAFKIPKKSDRVSLGASNPLHLWDIDSVNVVKTGERAKSELETRCQDSSSPSFNQVQVKQVSFEETYTSTLTQSGNAKYTKFQKTAEENVPNNSYNKHAKLPYRDEFYLEEPGQNLAQNVSCGKLSTPRVLITAPEISPKELQVSRGPKNQKQREREVIGDIAASMSCLYQLDKTGSGSSSSLSTSVGRKGEGTSSDSGSAEDLPEVGADGELPAQCQVAPPPSQDGTRNGHRSSAAAGDALPQPISPLRSKSAKQGQPVRGRGVEQIADDRKGRRAHPYSRPEHKVQREGKKYASFDLVYSLNELMTCMTSSTFKWSGRQCHLHGQRNQATYRRFANYRFKRSEVSAQDQEIEPEKLLTPDDIQDFEARKNLADMVETFPDPSTTGGFSNGEDTLSSMVTSNKDVPDIEDSRRIILTNDEDSVPSVSENLTLPSSSIETLKQSCTDVAVLSANTNLTQSSRSATDTLEGPLTDVAVSSSSSVFPMLHSVVSTPEDNNITTSNRLFEAEGPSLSTCHSSLDKPVSNNEVSTLTGDLGAESTDQECKDEVFTKEMLEKTEDGFLCQTMDEVGEPDTFDLNSCFDYNLPKATESEHSSSAEDRDAGERERDSLSGMHSGCNTVHEPFCQHSLALEFPVASKTSPSVASEQEDGQTVAGSSGDRNNTSSIDDIEKEDVSMESFDNAVICIHQVKEESTAFPQASNFCNSSEGEQILAGSCSVIKPVSDNIKDSEPQETQTTSSSVQDKECASLSEPTASPSLDLIYSLGNPHHNSLATEWSGSTFQSCDSEALVPKLSVRLSEESAGVGHAVDMQALLQKSPPPTQTHEMRAHAIGNMVQSFNQYSSRQTEGLPFQDCFLSSSPPPPPPPPLPPKLLPLSSRYSLPSLPSSPKVDKEEQQWLGTPLARPSAPDASNVLKTSKTKHMLSVMPQQDTDNLEQKFKVGGDQGISVVRKQSPVPYRYYVVHLRRLKKKIMYWEKKKVGRCLSKNEEKELDVLHAEYEKAKKHCKDYATSETEGSIKNMRTMKTGCHPLRHLKSIRTPERISFDHSPIKLKVDPELAKTDYSLVEVITGPARDPRLVPKCLREVMHRIKGWRRGQYNQPEASIKIVKVIPSVHSEGAVYTKKPALFPESNSREGIPCAKTVEKSIELDYPKKTLTELKNLCNSPSLDDPKGEHIATKLGQSPGIDTPGLWNHSHKITASAEAKGEKKMSYGQELLMHAQTTELMNESETKTCISENIFSKSSELFGDGKAFSVSQTAVLTEELLCEKPSSEQLEKSYQIVDQLNEERLCSDKEMSDQQKESRLFHFNDSNQNGPLHFQGSESAMAHKDSSERSLYFHKDHSSSVKEEVYGKQSEDPVNVTTTFGAEAKDTRSQSRLPSFEHEWSRELYNNVLWSDNSTNDSFGETKAQRVDEVLPVSNASPKELRSDTGATSEDADKTLAQGLALELEKKPHFEFSDVKEVFTKVDSSRMNSGEKASQFPVGGHTSLMHGKRKCPGTPTEEYLLVSTAKRVSPKFILKDSLVSSSSANVLLDRVSSDSGLKWMHSYPKDKDFQTSSNRKRNDSIEELPLLKLDPTSSKVLPEKTRSHSRFTSSPEYVESPCNSGVKKDTKHRIVFRDTEKNRAPSESLLWNENSPLSRNIIVISDESSCERADPRKISKLKKRSRFSPLKDPAEGSKKPPIMSLSQFEDLPKQSFSHLSKDSKSIGTRRFQDYEVDEFPAAVMAREKGLQSRSSAASSSYSGVIKPSAACSSDREEVRPSAEPWHPRDDGKQSSTYYRSRRESPAGRATSAKSPESTKAKNRTRAASEDKEPSLSAARDGQRASLSGSTDHTTSSGVIVPATAALTNFKMLSKLLQQLGDLNKKGHKWFMDIHISTICEIEDMRRQLPQYSPHVVETEKCLALLRSSQLSGLVKFIHLCPCRIQPGCALQQMAGCLRQRRGPEVRGIILTAPKEEGENSNDDWGDNDLGTVSVDKVVKFLSSFI